MNELRAPFPYFGGKRGAAPLIWSLLGDPSGYVEPFAGSAAVFLSRRLTGQRCETLNDADGFIANVWRSLQQSPDEVADLCVGPISEVDLHARLAWLHNARADADFVPWLEGDPTHHDPRRAAYWIYVVCASIGDAFGDGPWVVVDGHLRDSRKLPYLGDAGRGIARGLPYLGDAGQGMRLSAWFEALRDRLEMTRITVGDWSRVLTGAAMGGRRGGDGSIGVLLDPPYAGDHEKVYSHDDRNIGSHVRQWCKTSPRDLRVVLCGYHDEHDELLTHGWRKLTGRSTSGDRAKGSTSTGRERIWASPACLGGQVALPLDMLG